MNIRLLCCCLLLPVFVQAQLEEEKYNAAILKADSQYVKENYRAAVNLYAATFAENNNLGKVRDRFKAACCYSMLQLSDSAFYQLKRIVVNGHYVAYNQFLNEKKLDFLHADSRWQPLIDRMKSDEKKILEMINNPGEGN